ncbi:tetratricopeptide repeat protein [Acanthopleuribacter pedis]|uniref:O-antigen ligase family protein n=1 Tax=Acanthopleuribacter pedis TaxID=442870 RepID=A0A8J7U249_9BACT|nr:tetratricopeptide repeat protein [Acanthopleuribacter pedis]MBO1317339.1 O-antigen ligase family protein [Acanthopleuribacter pedis]MBO1318646.1 O-antigen ligase family protein [Acanthopleuribacter pedis]
MNEKPDSQPIAHGDPNPLALLLGVGLVPLAYFPWSADPTIPPRWALAALLPCYLVVFAARFSLRGLWPQHRGLRFALVLVVLSMLTSALTAEPSFNRLGTVTDVLIGLVFLTGAALAVHEDRRQIVTHLCSVVAVSITLCSLVGLLQVAGVPLEHVVQAYPPASLFANKNVAAQVLVTTAPLWFAPALIHGGRIGYVWVLLVGVNTAYLTAVESRTALLVCLLLSPMIAFGGALFGQPKRQTQQRFLVIGGCCLLMTAVLPGASPLLRRILPVLLWLLVTCVAFGLGLLVKQRYAPGRRGFARLAAGVGLLFLLANLCLWFPPGPVARQIEQVATAHNPDPHVNTVMVRGAMYQNAARILLRHPMGVGPGNFAAMYPLFHNAVTPTPTFSITVNPYRLHHDWLQIAVEHGVLALVGLWGFLAALLAHAGRRLLACSGEGVVEDPEVGAIDPALAVPIAVVMFTAVAACFSFPLEMPTTAVMFWLAVGLLVPVQRISRVKRSRAVVWVGIFTLVLIAMVAYFAVYLYGQLLLAEGRKWQRAGNAGFAFVYTNHAARVFPDDGTAFDHLVTLAASQGRNLDQSLAITQGYTAQYPNHANGWFRQAFVLRKRGDFSQAIEAVNQALRLGGADAAGFQFKGETLQAAGDWAGARKAYEQALAATPLYTPAVLCLQELDRLEGRAPKP